MKVEIALCGVFYVIQYGIYINNLGDPVEKNKIQTKGKLYRMLSEISFRKKGNYLYGEELLMNDFNKMKNYEVIVAFDVDGTLITFDDKPKYKMIDLFKLFKSMGCSVIIWSGGGKEYAEQWANRLGLQAEIYCKFDCDIKPDICIDDEQVKLGKVNLLC